MKTPQDQQAETLHHDDQPMTSRTCKPEDKYQLLKLPDLEPILLVRPSQAASILDAQNDSHDTRLERGPQLPTVGQLQHNDKLHKSTQKRPVNTHFFKEQQNHKPDNTLKSGSMTL